jgi:hypothetical protein
VPPEGGAAKITRPATDHRADVRERLLRWGWDAAEAERVADRIARREADDDRRTCIECAHYRPASHRCTNHKGAGLLTAAVGRDLAELPQRCPGFRARTPGAVATGEPGAGLPAPTAAASDTPTAEDKP